MNIWRHKKTGNLYVITGECKIEAEWMDSIKYIGINDLNRKEIIRPKAEFFDGRFERLNSMEYRNNSVILKASEDF